MPWHDLQQQHSVMVYCPVHPKRRQQNERLSLPQYALPPPPLLTTAATLIFPFNSSAKSSSCPRLAYLNTSKRRNNNDNHCQRNHATQQKEGKSHRVLHKQCLLWIHGCPGQANPSFRLPNDYNVIQRGISIALHPKSDWKGCSGG